MDQQNYFYGKHNPIGPLNYQAVFANSSSDYQTSSFNDPSSLHHTTGISFNSGTNGTNNVCSDLSNSTAANLSRSASNNLSANPSVNEFNTVAYNRLHYPYIPDNAVQNVTSASSNASDCSNITYGSTFNSKSYESTTNPAHVPVIAVTSNSSQLRGYHSNLNYGSYQNVDYSMHKTLNQNYSAGAIMSSSSSSPSSSSTQNRTTSSVSGFTNMSIDQPAVKSRSNNTGDAKISAKTSVIKPLNAYNTTNPTSGPAPINYTKYPSYPIYADNNKTVPTLEKSPATNRGIYLNSSATHKNSELYCPEPISARYSNPGYAINVSAPGTVHTNSHYLTANSYPLNYGHHHLAQHQNSAPHSARTLIPTAYQSPLDENVPTNYFNRPNGLVVRPTPNMYNKSQIPYQNTYAGYGRSNIPNAPSGVNVNHVGGSHSTFQKPQSHKSMDDAYNPMAIEFDSTYDRRNFRQYGSVYSSNYMEPSSFDDYSQYSGFAPTNAGAVPFYPTKATSKMLYNYNSSLNMYNSGNSHVPLTSPSATVSSSSVPTSSTTTTVQQPVPINPSSSQLISSNYDATSLHSHPILPPPLFNSNNKEYCSSNQYQQSPYASQILYTTLQNGAYYTSGKPPNQSTILPSNASDAHSLQNKVCTEKTMQPLSFGKYSTIDLEEQINSSKIPKTSGTVILNPKPNQRISDFETKLSVIHAQESQRQRKSGSSQLAIESNKNAFVYSDNSYSNCYHPQQQQQWQKSAALASSMAKTTATTTSYVHPKKQNLRDFLSSWNEDEEEEVDQQSKKPSNSHSHSHSHIPSHIHSHRHSHNHGSQSHIVHSKELRFDKPKRMNENVPVIVQPIIHPTAQVQPQNLHSAMVPQTYPGHPLITAPLMPPKIHVGVAVDNGTQNLPDIIIDIEKTKVSGEDECFERANVIQEAPKAKEKLYILDSIEVPLSELNKYKHLSVVNKLPDNIVLPPPPPLRHESGLPDVNKSDSIKFADEENMNHIQPTKNDFEENCECDDLVETKNMFIMQKFIKKLPKGKHRDQMRTKPKNLTNNHQSLQIPNEHNSDLSTPLRSLSPAHGFDVDEMASAVDLSVNSKEIDEFIDNFTICSDGNGSEYDLIASPLAEYLKLTEPQPFNDEDDGDRNDDKHESEKVEDVGNTGENDDEIKQAENRDKLSEERIQVEEQKDELVQDEEPLSGISIESLQNICIQTFNTKNFRSYFTENVINAPVEEDILPNSFSESENSVTNAQSEKEELASTSLTEEIVEPIETSLLPAPKEPSITDQVMVPLSSRIPTLRRLAMDAVLLNQRHMSANLKPFRTIYELDSERKFNDMGGNIDASASKVRTLQELAREVAVTIYSFNVKPLQDICKIAIDKFNHMYWMNRIDTNLISDTSASENMNNLYEVAPVDRLAQKDEPSTTESTCANEIALPLIAPDIRYEECSNDDAPVKPLKILAQICVDELNRCNEMEILSEKKLIAKNEEETVYISSESDSDTSSTRSGRSSQRGVISGGIIRSSCSDSDTSSGNESSSDSSSSDSESSDDERAEGDNKESESLKQIEPPTKDIQHEMDHDRGETIPDNQIMETIEESVQQEIPVFQYENNDSTSAIEKGVNEVYNPDSLKQICKNVLHDNSMILRYDVPTLKYLCEHALASAGMEIPLICFVNEEDTYEYISSEQPSQDEGVYLCLDGEFDETELANLFNGAGNGTYEALEMGSIETDKNAINNTSLIDQCVALQNILSSPPPEDNQANGFIEGIAEDTAYYTDTNTYTIGDEFHDSIQYEETVVPSENAEDFMVAIESFKKYLQNKYVQPSCYHKMFVINKLLRKYKVHQVTTCNKKPIVRKRLQKIISKLRQKEKQNRKPKKIATRRSARIADKIKQQELNCELSGKRTKSTKLNKNITNEALKCDAIENRQLCRILNVNDFIQNSGNKKPLTDTDKETIERDILKLIAKKRTLKRKLSICHRPTLNFDDDGYCYDEDGQISEMLSSFINKNFDEQRKLGSSAAKKQRSRKLSIEKKATKEPNKKKTEPQQHFRVDDEKKSKKVPPKKEKCKTVSTLDNKPQVVSSATNKTEMNTIHGTNTFPTKASVKEIIPAKRTRFLSIDGRSMKYGADSRKLYDQIKANKEYSGLPEISRRKIPQQNVSKKINDTATAKETVLQTDEIKPKRIRERRKTEVDRPKPKSPAELKSFSQSLQKAMEVYNKAQNSSARTKASVKSPPIIEKSKPKDVQPTKQTKTKDTLSLPRSETVPCSTAANIGEINKKPRRTRFSDYIQTSTEEQSIQIIKNNGSRIENNKSSAISPNVYRENSLLDRHLRSTMVSPLKIIIEPKLMSSPEKTPSQETTPAIDPLAFDIRDEKSSKAVEAPPANNKLEKKEVHKQTRFSDTFVNFIEKPQFRKNVETAVSFVKESVKSYEKSVPKSNGVPVHKSENKSTAQMSTTQPMPMKMNTNASARPLFDFETFLPSTKIPQPKPAKRCLARAQTISFAESPYRNLPPEPMKLRSSNDCMNLNKTVPPNESPIYQISSLYKSKDVPFTIPRRKPEANMFSSKRTGTTLNTNLQTRYPSPAQKLKIDMSNYPDPDSLQIPSIDLRASSSSRSPLPLPLKISSPAAKPIQMPLPLLKPPTECIETPPATPIEEVRKESSKTPEIIRKVCNSTPIPQSIESRQVNEVPKENHTPVPAVKMPTMPQMLEMNTIPLELDRVVNHQRKIREMQRRNSLCVAEISTHERNILSRFANSIKQRKLKMEDIIKICNKQPSPSSSSGSSSSSDSDSSDSDSSESNSTSSSSSGSVRKSRRYRKKKRSHKRNSDTDESSSESSSSSSSSSSSKHGAKRSKHSRKSTRKTTKQSKQRGGKKPNPMPIFDIEAIQQNALMGCALHEERIRNKLHQMSYSNIVSNQHAMAAVSSNTSDSKHDADHLKVPYVKLQRNSIIDDMAESYAQDQNSFNIALSTRYSRKRSN